MSTAAALPAPDAPPADLPLPGGFPFAAQLSLEPLIAWWQGHEADPNPGVARLAAAVGRQVADAGPAVRGPLAGPAALAAAPAGLLDTLMLAVFAPAAAATALSGAVVPFGRACFYATPRFAEVLLSKDDQLIKQPLNVDAAGLDEQLTRLAYRLILEREYGAAVPEPEAVIFTVPDYEVGLYRHYHLRFDSSFVRVRVRGGERPALTAEQGQALLRQRAPLAQWQAALPAERFVLEGFTLLTLVDVTAQEILSELKYDLLERDVLRASARLEQIQEKLRVLLARPALQVGLAAYDAAQRAFVDFGPQLHHSLLTRLVQEQAGFRPVYERLVAGQRPLVLPDVAGAPDEELPAGLRQLLLSHERRSLILAPLAYGPDTVGLLELGSPVAGDLDHFAAEQLAPLVPLFAVAVRRHAEELETRIQAIIKEEFTAIHPSLEWRFTEAARRLLARRAAGQRAAEMEAIVFENVYPLYGACDIRGSSAARNAAVQADLVEHLALAGQVLDAAAAEQQLPILDELRFFIAKNRRRLEEGLLSGDELSIYDSLKTEVEPLFEHLARHSPALRPAIEQYWAQMDPRRGILYRRRRAFEESVTQLNDALADYLDEQEAEAQQMFPHYFQRLKTDGIEYNIYVGSSLVQGRSFDLVFLKNLRLWQLLVMVELTRRAHALRETLPVPLETTQLILVHAQPLSVRFRPDERQFDVDGAYNIRYEIIKKRIDKATVLGTGERLTQPGHLALVYAQPREAAEYHDYLDYLVDRGLLAPGVEELELEELPGVKGLLALRVRVVV